MNEKEYKLVGVLLKEKEQNAHILKLLNNKVKDYKFEGISLKISFKDRCYGSIYDIPKEIQKQIKQLYINRNKEIDFQLQRLGYYA